MRVCLFTPTFLPSLGGAERMADVVVRGLIERGHEVRVLTQTADRKAGPMPEVPYRVHRYLRPPRQNFWPELLSVPLSWLHSRWRFDVVLAFYGYPTGFAAARIKDKRSFKLVVTPRGGDLYPNFHGLHRVRVPATIAAGYRGADRIVSISHWLTQRIVDVTGQPLEQLPPIDHVPNGIDLTAFDADLAAADRGSLPIEPPFLLQMARVHPVKQQGKAIDAIDRCRDAFESRQMTHAIVGDGPDLEALRQRVEELNLGHLVKLLGRRTGHEKAWLLKHAHGFVTTSREEGMPNAVLEAMAAGLPVLASDIGPHRELIEGQGWGVMFPTGDVAALAEALPAFLERDHGAMRQAALDQREQYSLQRTIDGYELALRRVLGDA